MDAPPHRTWEEGYADLLAFFEEQGHSRPPCHCLTGRWSADQRRKRKNGELSEEQIRLLDDINYEWESWIDLMDGLWQHMFKLLRNYKLEFGHTRVPQKEKYRLESLGTWVTNQQSLYRTNKLKDNRKAQLQEIGFEWVRDERMLWKDTRSLGKADEDWNQYFSLLCHYNDEHGEYTRTPSAHDAAGRWRRIWAGILCLSSEDVETGRVA
jgi:hypothetical protein